MKVFHAVAASAAAGVLIFGLTACSGGEEDTTSRDESGQITEGGDVGVLALQVGDCINDPALLGELSEGQEVSQYEAVPCEEVHTGEVVAVDEAFFAVEDDFPGEDVLAARADEYCVPALEEYTGQPIDAGLFDVLVLYPTQGSWDSQEDRGVACIGVVLSAETLAPIETTESMKAA